MSDFKTQIISFDDVASAFYHKQIRALIDIDTPVTHYDFGRGIEAAHRHPFGGGIVADSAKIARSVFVDKDCLISGNVLITGDVVIKDGSEISGDVQLNGSGKGIIITENTLIDEDVTISGSYSFKNSHISGSHKFKNSGKRYVNHFKLTRL